LSLPLIEEGGRHLAEGVIKSWRGLLRSGLAEESAIQSGTFLSRAHTGTHRLGGPIHVLTNSWSHISPRSAHDLDTPPQFCGSEDLEAGLVVLESIDRYAVADYQPYWAVRALRPAQKIGNNW